MANLAWRINLLSNYDGLWVRGSEYALSGSASATFTTGARS